MGKRNESMFEASVSHDGPSLSVTYFTTTSSFVTYDFLSEKVKKNVFFRNYCDLLPAN